MKVKFIFISAFVTLCALCFSCAQEMSDKENFASDKESIQINLFGAIIENRNGTLAFENREQLGEIINSLPQLSTPINHPSLRSTVSGGTNLTSINSLRENGFISLYDVFVDAMNNAEYYYERPGGYEEFKKKYNVMFFPEYEDDYSAYIPVSNKDLAKLADKNGDVIISGERISVIDIFSYEQLQQLGRTPPSNAVTLRATTGVNKIAEEVVGENKVWVNSNLFSGNSLVNVEVCFRKKGLLGVWYNHNSGTSAQITEAGFPYPSLRDYDDTHYEEFGFSSHDYHYARALLNGYLIPVNAKVKIYHAGTGKTLTLTLQYN